MSRRNRDVILRQCVALTLQISYRLSDHICGPYAFVCDWCELETGVKY